MTGVVLSEIWRYPVKSMRGERHQHLAIIERGFEKDRHWMLVDPKGEFLSQRKVAKMCLIGANISSEKLTLSLPLGEQCLVTYENARESVNVRIWGDHCQALTVDAEVDEWVCDFLKRPCRLVEIAPKERRVVDQDYAVATDQVGFADDFPFLLISQASLDDLNQRMDVKVAMDRFRPNLVVSGCEAFAEDDWKQIRIGDVTFRVSKPCSRCVIPSIDPLTAERDSAILYKMQEYRKRESKVYFGQNLIHDSLGELRQGMPVEIL